MEQHVKRKYSAVRWGNVGHKKNQHLCRFFFAEAEGFEPPVPCGTPVFKTGAIDQLCQTSRTAKVAQHIQSASMRLQIVRCSSAMHLLNDNIHYVK